MENTRMALASKKRKSSEPTPIEDLADELFVEILHRLPLNTSFHYKRVSKRLCRIISNPIFIRRLAHMPNPITSGKAPPFALLFHPHVHGGKKKLCFVTSQDRLFILEDGFSLSFLPCFQPEKVEQMAVVASNHDLLLCPAGNSIQREYYVCNPITEQWFALPPNPISLRNRLMRVGLIYDPSQCRFRVLCIPYVMGETVSEFMVEIFSSETSKWSHCKVSRPLGFNISSSPYRSGLVYNGKLLWWERRIGFSACIDPFNGRKYDNWPIIGKPEWILDDRKVISGLCKGKLRLCESMTVRKNQTFELSVREYEDGTESWVVCKDN